MIVNVLSISIHMCVYVCTLSARMAESEDVSYRPPSHMWMSSSVIRKDPR